YGGKALAFSPDGKRFASSTGRMVSLWDRGGNDPLHQFPTSGDPPAPIAFSPDGTLLAAASAETVELRDPSTGGSVAVLRGHRAGVSALAFSPDGKRLATGGRDKTVRLWEVATRKEMTSLPQPRPVTALAFSPDGGTLAVANHEADLATETERVLLLDATTGKARRRLDGPTAKVCALAFSPDGQTLGTGGSDHRIRLWDAVTGKELLRRQEHAFSITQAVFAPDGKTVASASLDRTVRLWDWAAGKQLLKLEGHDEVHAVAFAPDGKFLASGGADGAIQLWDAATGKKLNRLSGHTSRVARLLFAPDGKTLVSGSLDRTVRLWDVASGKERVLCRGHRYGVVDLALSDDGSVLASGDGANVLLWGGHSGKEQARLPCDGAYLALAPDGKTLLVEDVDESLRLLALPLGREQVKLEGERYSSRRLAFAPDGHTAAAGNRDGSITLWEMATGTRILRLSGHQQWVSSVAFSPDGRLLVSASGDSTLLVWKVAAVEEPNPKGWTQPELESLWTRLLDDNAAAAYPAIWRLGQGNKEVVAFLKGRLRPVSGETLEERARRLIADLDDKKFVVRERSLAELKGLGNEAAAVLREALMGNPPLEARRRIEQLLMGIEQLPRRGPGVLSGERLRTLRALQVLERIGTPEARAVMQILAEGRAAARETIAAQAALQRLARRSSVP
ncbi:MAG TPA: WD40 repeat domain-containing protein, partial [Gemmataceae bacterium]|nr:WD40 repeat domain-containing protein [Gemmataceae bacterium]